MAERLGEPEGVANAGWISVVTNAAMTNVTTGCRLIPIVSVSLSDDRFVPLLAISVVAGAAAV
jgi:hypothetical protein